MQDKEDLYTLVTKKVKNFMVNGVVRKKEHDIFTLMHTSGTTEFPLPVCYTKTPDWNPSFLSTGSRIIMLFGSIPLQLDFINSSYNSKVSHQDILFLSGNQLSVNSDIEIVINNFKPDTLVSPPSIILKFAECSSEKQRNDITQIILAGELITENIYSQIKTQYTQASITSMYVSTETGLLGVSCEKCAVSEYHVIDGVCFNIADVDVDVDVDGVGEIYITKKNKGGLNLEEYRIGDMGSYTEHDNELTVTIHGRKGFDYIKLSNMLLLRKEFDRVISLFPHIIADYKVEVQPAFDNGKSVHMITLCVVLRKNKTGSRLDVCDYISEEVSKELFVTPSLTLSDVVSKNICEPLIVSVVSKIKYLTKKPQKLYVVHNKKSK